ncbi:MAG: S9 family peptidase [Chitinophagaceae bacterium]|nr:S9 family peptidase [Chitinophagaceae bacterium]
MKIDKFPEGVQPPVAKMEEHVITLHGDTLRDPYFWLRDDERKDSAVIAYLNAENAYLDIMMSGTKKLQEELFKEMRARIKEKDESVPVFNKGYYYYSRTEEGKEYYKYCRKKGSLDAPEEVLLDVDEMAKGFDYYSIGGVSISDDQNLMAYSVDTVSRRQYTIYIKNLQTGELFSESIPNTEGQAVWASDNKTFFYTTKNLKTLLSEKIYRHEVGSGSDKDVLVYTEKDPSNYIGVTKSKSDKYIFIVSQATLSSEWLMIKADEPTATFKPFQKRIPDVLYSVSHTGKKFVVRTNKDAVNFRLMECPEENTAMDQWKDLVPHRDDVLLEGVDVFAEHMVLVERKDGLLQLRITDHSVKQSHYIDFGEPAYTAYPGNTPDFNSKVFRFMYTSLTTPYSTYDYGMDTKEKKLLKQQEVLGGYKPENYVTERLWAKGTDGTRIPISIVYKKGFKKDGTSPVLQYAYGSYGSSMDAAFDGTVISLLDRGFAYAIAHIRGGQEMGRKWYEDGRLLKKKNSFTDFIACGEFLINEKYAAPGKLYAQGGSAGGLLMGAVVNMRPDLWHGVIAQVPFVDVINTMLDESIPLTTNEFDEWGNPKNKEYYDYMKSYSPYDNVKAQAYPNMLVTTGLHDSQVQYWEPAKWVAKLRATKTDNNLLLLKTQMSQGHGGASGRFEYLKDVAIEWAFLLALEAK